MSLESVNTALEFLKQYGCVRDPQRGLWVTATGLALECGPVESAAMLRRNLAAEHYHRAAVENRTLTR